MTSRSIVLGTALILAAALPAPTALAPAPAMAQEASPDAAAALADPTPPSALDLKVLRQRAAALRTAIQSGAIKGPDRKPAAAKLASYRAEIQKRQQASAAEQPAKKAQQTVQSEANQSQTQAQAETQPAQKLQAQLSPEAAEALADSRPASALETPVLRQRIQTLRGALQSMGPAQRKTAVAKIKADREEFVKRQQALKQKQEQTTQAPQATDQPQTAETQGASKTQVSGDAAAALADERPSASLETADLRKRFLTLRTAIRSGALGGPQQKKAQQMFAADRQELMKRNQAAKQAGTQAQATTQTQETQASAEVPAAEAQSKAKALLADKTDVTKLDDKALRKRLAETRAVLASKSLTPAEQRALRQRLANDRNVLRERVSNRQEQTASVSNETAQGSQVNNTVTNNTGVVNNTTTINNTVNNVNVIVQEQTPAERLNQRQLNQRIRTLRVALREERLDKQRTDIAEHILIEDRRFLRQRLIREREARRERWRRMRDRNEIHIDFNIAIIPPPIIAAAEADYEEIETQLIAPPRRVPPQRYSFEQIVEDDDIRQAMPGIDIDTLNFDTGSAEIRPEEVEKLDSVAEAIEKIVTVRPNEVFVVEGHTDAVGSEAANQALSQARAESVKQALVEYYAIDPGNMRIVGLGERFLKIPTEEAEEENRRVTIRRITPLLTGEAG